jgi:hypothetical protein
VLVSARRLPPQTPTGQVWLRSPLVISLTALTLLAVPASAAEQTREGYVAAVEPICKSNKAAADRLLGPVKGLVRRNKLKQAATAFSKAATELEKTQKRLALVPQPPADAAKLGQWLTEIKGEVTLMRTIATKFRQGKKGPASSLAVKLQQNATKANNLVIAFQFNYCRIDPTKYT